MSFINCSGRVALIFGRPSWLASTQPTAETVFETISHFFEIDFVRRVGGTVIIRVQARREEGDRNAHLGEVVMIAAIEDALARWLRP